MARYAPLTHPVAGGIARGSRASHAVGRATALGAVLFLLECVGSLAFRVADRLRLGFADWAAERRQREEDRKLWELALSDSRVMSDLIAIRQATPPHGRGRT